MSGTKKKYMVFDVESVGLHGEGFAVGYVVVDEDGAELDSRAFACHPNNAVSLGSGGRDWIKHNIPELRVTHDSPWLVRRAFWSSWNEWKAKGATLAADVPWPVEARFLARCVDDNHESRERDGPYPLIDVASVRLAVGLDPLETGPRLDNEKPQHDPLADARQSARLLIEALNEARIGVAVSAEK